MADERFETHGSSTRPLGTWTMLFRGFQVAVDWRKLLLAAGGIVTMWFAWWLLAVIFGPGNKPIWPGDYVTAYQGSDEKAEVARQKAWEAFKSDRKQWNLRYDAASDGQQVEYLDAGDLATSEDEYNQINDAVQKAIDQAKKTNKRQELTLVGRKMVIDRKAAGKLRVSPWFEDRGPNPYLMVTGQAGRADADGTPRYAPWDRGQFFDWFTTKQLPVLVEPLAKFFRPIVYFLKPDAGFRNRTYFFCVIVATLAVWSVFGGAITRMAAVQLTRKEKITFGEAFRFARGQWKSFFLASILPLVFLAVIVVLEILFGYVIMIPVLGDLFAGLLWPLILAAGVLMALALVGYLVGWPLFHATISTEGSDTFDALSRTYSYVYQSPWNYFAYVSVALAYGAVVVFVVGFMGSLSVYLGKWGVSLALGPTSREPSYLFVHAPTSFGWRDLLLQGATVKGTPVVDQGELRPELYKDFLDDFAWYQHLGAFLVSMWIYLVFLMVIGFGYSYFWCAGTIIYLLMRHRVDDTDLDEVYLEEEDIEDVYTPPPPPEAPVAKPGTTSLTMVEPPAPRPAPAATTAPDGEKPGANP